MTFRIGVDIGGTFTDFALIDDRSGELTIHKQLTTPHDPSVSVIEGCRTILAENDARIEDVSAIVHGTTLVTNAVIERKGAPTALLVTAGFSDVLDIGLERRYDLFDLGLRFPTPLVARDCRIEVRERIAFDGQIREPIALEEVEAGIRRLVDIHAIKSIAICFLNSFVNPEHELAAKAFVRQRLPELYVSTSSEIFPYIREYERWTTTTINAFTQPIVENYLRRLEDGLGSLGFGGRLYIMASNGGTITPKVAAEFPVRMLESGPAAGALMSAFHGKRLGLSEILSFDMGGTTAKGCIISNGRPLKRYSLEVARIHEFKAGSGLPVRIPVIDMIEIGSGGGSLAEVDSRDVLRVGPRSSGADPGPACYGRGGQNPSLTDADLSLGYLDPEFFLGGKMPLDRSKSEAALSKQVGKPLKVEVTRAAWGVHEIANEDVARAFRVHASERGVDYRNCAMVAFGGAGPLRASRVARKLKIPKVVFPVGAGVMSALGLLSSPMSFEIVKSGIISIAGLTAEDFTKRFSAVANEAVRFLLEAGVSENDITVLRHLDMRYVGQGYEIEVSVPVDDKVAFASLPQLFAKAYEEIFSLSFLDQAIEIVNWKVEARGPVPTGAGAQRFKQSVNSAQARKGVRRAFFPEKGTIDCPVFDRYALKPGEQVSGPALIEENESTVVVGVGDSVTVDRYLNLICTIATSGDAA
jgi:N-methylhydantoinase A